MDVLCVGAAVVDIMASPIPEYSRWKEKQRIGAIGLYVGGDAANQAVRLADAGEQAALCAAVGDDGNGQMLRGLLEARGVNTDFLRVKKEYATGTALVLVDEMGKRSIFSVKGAHSSLDRRDLPGLLQPVPRAVSLASLFLMPELEKSGMEQFLKGMKKEGVRIFADLGNDKLGLGLDGIRPFLPLIDYFLPSVYDALEMTGTRAPEDAARVYRKLGCRNVIIKCGAEGCICLTDSFCGHIPALPVKPVDTTGAGDTMVALFIHRILQGDGVEAAARYACLGASLSTLQAGASAVKLMPDEIEKVRNEIQIRKDIWER